MIKDFSTKFQHIISDRDEGLVSVTNEITKQAMVHNTKQLELALLYALNDGQVLVLYDLVRVEIYARGLTHD